MEIFKKVNNKSIRSKSIVSTTDNNNIFVSCRDTSNNTANQHFRRGIYKLYDHLKRHAEFGFLKKLITDKRGNTLLGILLGFTLAMFLALQPIDTFAIQVKHQKAEKIVNTYLNRMRLEGLLTSTDESAMIEDFSNINCIISNPTTEIESNARESMGSNRILRNTDPTASQVTLEVTCTPDPQPFKLMQLVGGSNSPTTIKVGGRDLSERVNP